MYITKVFCKINYNIYNLYYKILCRQSILLKKFVKFTIIHKIFTIEYFIKLTLIYTIFTITYIKFTIICI